MASRQCSRCVMDDSAEEFEIHDDGVCNFCRDYDENIRPIVEKSQSWEREDEFKQMVDEIKQNNDGKYDAILGLSGGRDSSYTAYKMVKYGLEPLILHIDTGWNSKVSNNNVEKVVDGLDLDMVTYSIDKEIMYDVHLSFIKASVMDIEVPHDHVLRAFLYKATDDHDIQYLIQGTNYVTEAIHPLSWTYIKDDINHIRSIQKQFGEEDIANFPFLSIREKYLKYILINGVQKIRPLNYIKYVPEEAEKELEKEFGWEKYDRKHGESVITRFFQNYYLPKKFGIDKRKTHLSTLINSGQISREDAIEELNKPHYRTQDELERDMKIIADNFGISVTDFKKILNRPNKNHTDYPNSQMKHKAIMFLTSQIPFFAKRK